MGQGQGRDWGVGAKMRILLRAWSSFTCQQWGDVELEWKYRAGSEIKLVGLELRSLWGWDSNCWNGGAAVVMELIVGLGWSHNEDPAMRTWSSFT